MVKDVQKMEGRSNAGKKGGGNPNLNKQNPKHLFKQNPKQNTENEYEYEKVIESTKKKGGAGEKGFYNDADIDLSFLDSTFLPIMQTWITYKKTTKKPFRNQMEVEAAYRELMVLADNDLRTAKNIIDQSISNSYMSLNPLKSTNKVNPKVKEQFIPMI